MTRKQIPARPGRQSDDWQTRAPIPLAHLIELGHRADMDTLRRQAEARFGQREG